jgi:hypothetical protein
MIRYMSENIDRELKTEILKSLGDLFLGLKRYGEKYIDTIISISSNCFEAVYKLAGKHTLIQISKTKGPTRKN